MAFYRLMERPPTGVSYLRFLLLCGGGFTLGGCLLIVLGSFAFDPNHEAVESKNVESIVAWTAGCLAFAVAIFFAGLAVLQWKKVIRMRSVASNLLVEGQENTLYQAMHGKAGYHQPHYTGDDVAVKGPPLN